MNEPSQFYLLDLENVPAPLLAQLPSTARLVAFIRATEKRVSTDLLRTAASIKERYSQIEVESKGEKNAMDFHIACEIGRILERDARNRCVIISKDTGFDPLVRHLKSKGHDVRRQADIVVARKVQAPIPKPPPVDKAAVLVKRVADSLARIPAPSRPRTLKRLANKFGSELKAELSPQTKGAPTLEELLKQLIGSRVIREEGGKLIYSS